MDAWQQLVRLGDPRLTLPAAVALSAALLALGAWRLACWWSLLFGVAIGLVVSSKIGFMGWGGPWQALCYKALSGHAAGAGALFPVLLYLLPSGGARLRMLGAGAGLALGALVAAALVASGQHSWAEALAGWCVGAAAGVAALRMAGSTPAPPRPLGAMLAFALVFASGIWLMQWVHPGYWMIKAARMLSGHEQILNLHCD